MLLMLMLMLMLQQSFDSTFPSCVCFCFFRFFGCACLWCVCRYRWSSAPFTSFLLLLSSRFLFSLVSPTCVFVLRGRVCVCVCLCVCVCCVRIWVPSLFPSGRNVWLQPAQDLPPFLPHTPTQRGHGKHVRVERAVRPLRVCVCVCAYTCTSVQVYGSACMRACLLHHTLSPSYPRAPIGMHARAPGGGGDDGGHRATASRHGEGTEGHDGTRASRYA